MKNKFAKVILWIIGIIAVLISFWTGNDDTSQGIIKRDGFPATAVLIGSSCMLLILSYSLCQKNGYFVKIKCLCFFTLHNTFLVL